MTSALHSRAQVRSRARLAVSCRSASANTAGRPSGSSDNAGPAKHPRAEAESSTSYSWTEDSWAALGMRLALERIYRLNETETGRQQQRLPAAPGLESLEVGSFAVMAPETPPKPNNNDHDYYANVGDAIRTLREEVPLLFVKDLTCEWRVCWLHCRLVDAARAPTATGAGSGLGAADVTADTTDTALPTLCSSCTTDDIYREDIVFRDPRNTFKGMKNYKTIFWSLRFHGSIFFKSLYVDVRRIWQPEPNIIQVSSAAGRGWELKEGTKGASGEPRGEERRGEKEREDVSSTGSAGGKAEPHRAWRTAAAATPLRDLTHPLCCLCLLLLLALLLLLLLLPAHACRCAGRCMVSHACRGRRRARSTASRRTGWTRRGRFTSTASITCCCATRPRRRRSLRGSIWCRRSSPVSSRIQACAAAAVAAVAAPPPRRPLSPPATRQ